MKVGPALAALLGVATATVGVGLAMIGSAQPTGSAGVVGGNAPINQGARDPLDISANNSPSVAVDPTNPAIVVAANRIDTPRFSCAMHVSGDGGASWQVASIPVPLDAELPPRCYAPDLAFGADGRLHLSYVTLEGPGNVPDALWLSSSSDGGRTMSAPVRVSGPFAFQARLAADPRLPGRLYLTWLQAAATGTLSFPQTGNPIVVSRSDDGGRTWGKPVPASPPSRERVVAPSVAVDRRGEIRLLYLDIADDVLDYAGAHEGRGGEPYPGPWSLVMARSKDQGATWKETVVAPDVVPTERFVVFLPAAPSLAVDSGGRRVYVSFHDGRLGDADIWLWASADGGDTFGPPVRVNDTPRRDRTSQYLPRLAVAPGGRLDVVYFDRRADTDNVMNDVSWQSSYNHGRSFRTRLSLSDRPFDSRIGSGAERGLPDLGSRLALIATDQRALVVWPDTRAGTAASRKQDLSRAVVGVSRPSPLRRRPRTGGWVGVLAGGLVVTLAGATAWSRRTGHTPDPV